MKVFFNLFFLTLLLVACNRNNVEPQCESTSALIPCEQCHGTWNCMNMPRPADSYNYPLCPGMEEWKNLKTGEEMADACQVPLCELEKMSTQAVIQAIWEHPLLIVTLYSSSWRYLSILESFSKRYNVGSELAKRKDAGDALFERLVLINPVVDNTVVTSSLTLVLEIMISQTVFLSQINSDQKGKIVEICLKTDDLRQGFSAKHSWTTTWLLAGRTMASAGYAPFLEAMNSNEEMKMYIVGWRPNPSYPTIDPNRELIGYDYYRGSTVLDIEQQIINFCKQFLTK